MNMTPAELAQAVAAAEHAECEAWRKHFAAIGTSDEDRCYYDCMGKQLATDRARAELAEAEAEAEVRRRGMKYRKSHMSKAEARAWAALARAAKKVRQMTMRRPRRSRRSKESGNG